MLLKANFFWFLGILGCMKKKEDSIPEKEQQFFASNYLKIGDSEDPVSDKEQPVLESNYLKLAVCGNPTNVSSIC